MEPINQTLLDNRNHLLLLGTGAAVCLLILTVISVLDLRMDYKKHSSFPNKRAMSSPGMLYAPPDTSICPLCRMTVIPYCSYCGSQVHWDAPAGKYYCSVCKKNIRVICPDCGIPMKPFYQPLPPNGTQLALPYGAADALCICPSCRTKIVPTCFYCGDHVQWDSAAEKYYCPICKKNIDVLCTNCGIPMKPFFQSSQPNGVQAALPGAPGGGTGGIPGYLICPNCAYKMLNQPGLPLNNIMCPGCSYRMNSAR